jgi:hypothetical protein
MCASIRLAALLRAHQCCAYDGVMVRKNDKPAGSMTDAPPDTSDKALADILKRLKETDDPAKIRELSGQLERVIFHKQFENA